MRNTNWPWLNIVAKLLAALFLVFGLSACATTSKKDDAAREAYVTRRTKYYLNEGGLSDESTASTAAYADWEAGKAMEDTDKRLGLGQYQRSDR
jgi:hypothetical protein